MKKTESQSKKMEAYISVVVYSMSMNLWQDAQGEVIDKEDTLFMEVDGRSFFLGVRKLPVYIRKRYSKTKQEVKGQKRKKKKKKTGSLEKWIPGLYSEDEINWRELSVY